MTFRYTAVISALVATVALISCQNKKRETAHEFSQLIDREILFPNDMAFTIGADTVDICIDDCDYKIVTYIDSTGCTSCRMKLQQWDELACDFKRYADIDIEVLMIINATKPMEVAYLLKRDGYLHPVAMDSADRFDKLNELPPSSEFHTFLLNADNKIVAIGNPVLNPKIKELYHRVIAADSDDGIFNGTDENISRTLGVVHANDTVKTKFLLTNKDSIAYHIQDIIPSCDCISASARNDTILPNSNDPVEVKFVADTTGGRFCKYIDVFYNEKEKPDRLTVYGYIK